MVIDTSAVVAVLNNDAEAASIRAAIQGDPVRLMSASSVLEAAIVIEALYGEAGGRELDLFLHKAGIEVVAFDAEQMELARYAYRRFGRGYHPAKLNFGDGFSYALSRRSGEPVLYVGNDFGQTDIGTITL